VAESIADTLAGLAGLAVTSRALDTREPRAVTDVCRALDEFNECVRYINTRRSKGAILELESESAVQDAVYLMLRPWVPDLIPESPTEKSGNRFTIADFTSRALRLCIEVKYVRDKAHGKAISKELHDDIEVYRHHHHCDTIVFFVYDPDSNIPDERELRRTIEQSRVYDGRPLSCVLIVKP
jgi:hypothetical protein